MKNIHSDVTPKVTQIEREVWGAIHGNLTRDDQWERNNSADDLGDLVEFTSVIVTITQGARK